MAASLSTEVFFIVDGERLEAQACLLAPSLKKNLSKTQKPVAYVRQDYRTSLADFTKDVLDTAGIEVRSIPKTNGTHAPWSAPYPQGNKILAAAAPRKCDISVFIDTDTILAQKVNFARELGNAQVAAVVSDYAPSAGSDEDWEHYYQAFDLPVPEERVQLHGGRRLITYPYFNAGVVIFRERGSNGKPTHVGRDWLKAALQFEKKVTRDYDRSNIDQFTLPILGYLRDAPVKALDQHLNYNIQADGNDTGQEQTIAHYHQIGVLWAHPRQGPFAYDGLIDLLGPEGPDQFLQAFGPLAKRNRMKRHMQAAA